jgi:hypothetical protein
MKSLLAKSAAIIAACAALTSAQAGTTGGKIIAPTVTPEVDDSLGMEASIGYDSRYYFRGLWFSNHNVWTSISTSIPLGEIDVGRVRLLYRYRHQLELLGTGPGRRPDL